MTIDGWIAEGARAHPERLAIEGPDGALSYGAFHRLIETRAAQLAASGVGRGDRIAWLGFNRAEVFVLLFAAARLGALLVPLNWRLADGELSGVLEDCAPKIVFHDAKAEARAQALAPDQAQPVWPEESDAPPAPLSGHVDDPLLIVYTSGSTGRPKGAVLTQAALRANAEMSIDAHGLTTEDRALVVLPLFHVGGLNILPTPAFSVGASVELHELFDPAKVFEALGRVTLAITVPTVLQAIMAQPGWEAVRFETLRALSIGSTDVPRALIDAVHDKGIPLVQIYGATETSPFAIYQNVESAMASPGSIGRAGSACEIRLMRPDGGLAEEGEPGEIQVRGPNVLVEYWRNPGLTEAAFQDGWFRTGDVARRDENGEYWFTDRIKHVIISGGENIYPAEIERILRAHAAVKEVAVVGAADPRWGETPVAVVVRDGEVSEVDLLAALDGRLARYKRPSRVVFTDALPRNAMGKVVAEEVKALL
ncbi:MAG: AMP-binding protein [Silicimonas sp.]|nr:AMP-binding protein [Silicimonas sp.]